MSVANAVIMYAATVKTPPMNTATRLLNFLIPTVITNITTKCEKFNVKIWTRLCENILICLRTIKHINVKYYNLGKKNFGIYDKILLNKEKYTDYYIVHFQASRRNTHKFVNKIVCLIRSMFSYKNIF